MKLIHYNTIEVIVMRLRDLRTAHKYSQKDLSDLLGVDRTTYVKWETGASAPSIAALIQIADHYGVSLDYLAEHVPADSSVFSADEKKLLALWRGADADARKFVMEILELHQKASGTKAV